MEASIFYSQMQVCEIKTVFCFQTFVNDSSGALNKLTRRRETTAETEPAQVWHQLFPRLSLLTFSQRSTPAKSKRVWSDVKQTRCESTSVWCEVLDCTWQCAPPPQIAVVPGSHAEATLCGWRDVKLQALTAPGLSVACVWLTECWLWSKVKGLNLTSLIWPQPLVRSCSQQLGPGKIAGLFTLNVTTGKVAVCSWARSLGC